MGDLHIEAASQQNRGADKEWSKVTLWPVKTRGLHAKQTRIVQRAVTATAARFERGRRRSDVNCPIWALMSHTPLMRVGPALSACTREHEARERGLDPICDAKPDLSPHPIGQDGEQPTTAEVEIRQVVKRNTNLKKIVLKIEALLSLKLELRPN